MANASLPFPLLTRRSPPTQRLPAEEARFFHDLVEDLDVSVEWLRQVVDGAPEPAASSSALAHARAWAGALRDLHGTIRALHAHVDDGPLSRLFTLDGPLAAFLSCLCAWCDEISTDVERLVAKLRHREPVLGIFPYDAVNESLADLEHLSEALRRGLADAHPATDEACAAWRTLCDDFEQVLWATESLHVSLASEPAAS